MHHADAGKARVMTGLSQEHNPAPVRDTDQRRHIVLIGLMGAGKSCVGRRLATRLGWDFVDADSEIETAAGCSIPEIFERHGERYFRDGERRVIARLLAAERPQVIATGGGAYMDAETRAAIAHAGVAVWLRADLDVLVRRTARRDNRPLLKKDNPRRVLKDLMEERYPIYAQADLTVDSADGPLDASVARVLQTLQDEGWLPAAASNGETRERS